MNLKYQTLSRLQELQIKPKRSLGQNFLISENIVDRVIQRVKTLEVDEVIEIGPGLGALTEPLLQWGHPFQVIELDDKLAQYWKSRGVEVWTADALQFNWGQILNHARKYLLVSNLPYQISSSLVIDLSGSPCTLVDMVLMFQKEVAQRILASPATKAYGFLSVIAQNSWHLSRVAEVGPRCFWPVPKIASQVLHFKRKSEVIFPKDFIRLVKSAFSQRRKIVWKNWTQEYHSTGWSQDQWLVLGKKLGFHAKVRAEELSPSDFRAVFDELKNNWGENKSVRD